VSFGWHYCSVVCLWLAGACVAERGWEGYITDDWVATATGRLLYVIQGTRMHVSRMEEGGAKGGGWRNVDPSAEE
jgi:hypothetical protein